jgi:arylsulfatase A-like enzyme
VTGRSSFFAHSNPNNPSAFGHPSPIRISPTTAPSRGAGYILLPKIDLPVHRSKDFEQRPWWHRASQENEPKIDDAALRRTASQGMRIADQSDAQLADMIANYFGMLSLIDHNVGRMLEAVQQHGLLDNTLIIYSSDSSDLLGDHGLHLKVPVAYEGMLRMPMILSGPGVPANLVLDDPVSTMDIAATIDDQAAVDAPSTMQAEPLLPLLPSGCSAKDARLQRVGSRLLHAVVWPCNCAQFAPAHTN